ncbi:Uncharacterised protein [Mycobacteroides abscessus subsp. abscessus]|nr:Uncharacterised protein [Mycobacteroides abscessus subsp. abscessus]
MSDPAISAAQRAWDERYRSTPDKSHWIFENSLADDGIAKGFVTAAREMAESVQEQLAVIRERYELVRTWRALAVTPAEVSRHSSELSGLRYAYDLIAPTVYPSEELGL